jgi:hypothetical protein
MKNARPTTRRIGLLLSVPVVIGVATLIAMASNHGNQTSAAPKKKQAARKPAVRFTADGKLIRPTDYRRWIYAGTPLTPNDMNDGKAAFPEFHSVYIDPNAYDHYERTSKFPDGTVLVKELVSVGTKEATSGNGYFMGDFTGLEVLMKDKTRFKDEPGNWAFFSFGHEYPLKAAAKMQATANCNDCHGGAADDDYVFTQYYPVLRAAKGSLKSR